MEFKDLALAPLYTLIIVLFLNMYRNNIKSEMLRKYFLYGFLLKVVGAISVGLIYFYYYEGGDTTWYHSIGKMYSETSQVSWNITYKIITQGIGEADADTATWVNRVIFYQKGDHPTYLVIRIIAFCCLFSFDTYSVNAIFFALFSFAGSWGMFRVFDDYFPGYRKRIIIAVFFLPSVVFWGSGLMKDSLTYGALGLVFYGFYFGLIKPESVFKAWALFALGFIMILKIKVYILYCLIPSLMLWLYFRFGKSIKSVFVKVIIGPAFLILFGTLGFFTVRQATAETDYSFDKLSAKTQVTADYLRRMSDESGSYDLGLTDYSPMGMLSVLPKAVGVTLFRPFIWEAGFNPVRLLAALENLAFLLATIWLFWKVSIPKIFELCLKYPLIPVCLFFAVGFSFAVGVATSNFGTLVRYKIPMMPFYIISIFMLISLGEKNRRRKSRRKSKRKPSSRSRRKPKAAVNVNTGRI